MSAPPGPPQLSQQAVEQELQRVGGELAESFPSNSRHPVRALDARAMEMASVTESCARRCFGSSMWSRRAARSTTSPAI